MLCKNEYVLNYETAVFIPDYDDNGKLTTIVITQNDVQKVNIAPTQLMDFNLKYLGSSLRGAMEGSRMILGPISMPPLVINETTGIYWFPSTSPKRDDCVWFALQHIKEYKEIGKKKTQVILTNGCVIEIDVSYYTFEKKVQRAYKLKGKIEERIKQLSMEVVKTTRFYHICREKLGRNYELMLRRK